jgi:hypothetical protein
VKLLPASLDCKLLLLTLSLEKIIQRRLRGLGYSFSSDNTLLVNDFIWSNVTSKHSRKVPLTEEKDWDILPPEQAVDRLEALVLSVGHLVPELRYLTRKGAATHCNAIPISSFARGNDVHGDPNTFDSRRKSLIPAKDLPEATRITHKHLNEKSSKRRENRKNKEVWFASADGEQGLFGDGLRHCIIHNTNFCLPFKPYTVVELDVAALFQEYQMSAFRTSRSTACPGFKATEYNIPIEKAYVVQCGKWGTVYEPTASISLVRDNHDMKTPIEGKRWTVKDLMDLVPDP